MIGYRAPSSPAQIGSNAAAAHLGMNDDARAPERGWRHRHRRRRMVGVGLEEGAIHMRRPYIILGIRDPLPPAVVDVEFHNTAFHTAVHVRLSATQTS